MSSAFRYEIYPASFVHAGGTMDLRQLSRFRIELNEQMTRVRPGGSIDGLAFITARAKPVVRFGTADLATFFTDVSPSVGLAMTGDATMRLQERSNLAVFETGATHITVTGKAGVIFPNTITAELESADGAVLEASYVPLWDGTNNVLKMTDGVNFATAPAVAFGSQFYLGPVYHNAVEMKGPTRIQVDFGLTFSASPTTPHAYDKNGAFTDRNPVLQIDFQKVDVAAALHMINSAVTSSFAIYLRRGVASSDRVTDATVTNIKISCTAGSITWQDLGGDAAGEATVRMNVKPTSLIALSIASAIP